MKGEPGIGVRTPVERSIVNANKSLVVAPFLSFDSYRYLPSGSEAKELGFAPAGKGEPGTGVRLPVFESTENAEILPVSTLPYHLLAT
jgi:hypothetical protein